MDSMGDTHENHIEVTPRGGGVMDQVAAAAGAVNCKVVNHFHFAMDFSSLRDFNVTSSALQNIMSNLMMVTKPNEKANSSIMQVDVPPSVIASSDSSSSSEEEPTIHPLADVSTSVIMNAHSDGPGPLLCCKCRKRAPSFFTNCCHVVCQICHRRLETKQKPCPRCKGVITSYSKVFL